MLFPVFFFLSFLTIKIGVGVSLPLSFLSLFRLSSSYATVKLSAVPRAAAAPPALYQRLSPTTTSCTKSVFLPSLLLPTAAVSSCAARPPRRRRCA